MAWASPIGPEPSEGPSRAGPIWRHSPCSLGPMVRVWHRWPGQFLEDVQHQGPPQWRENAVCMVCAARNYPRNQVVGLDRPLEEAARQTSRLDAGGRGNKPHRNSVQGRQGPVSMSHCTVQKWSRYPLGSPKIWGSSTSCEGRFGQITKEFQGP